MLSSTASTSTFLAEKICVLENDIDRIKEKMGEIENVYPRIYLGECSKKSTLKNYSILNIQLTDYNTRIGKLDDDLRGKLTIVCTYKLIY